MRARRAPAVRARRTYGELDARMEPAADVVFLLLVFFLFSFQVQLSEVLVKARSSVEASPQQASSPPDVGAPPPVERELLVALVAEEDGSLAAIDFGGKALRTIEELRVETYRLNASEPTNRQVALTPDVRLHYEHVVSAAAVFHQIGWLVELRD